MAGSIRDSGSPGTASMKASSTTITRLGRRSAAMAARGYSTLVGLVGLPTTTRSASSSIAAGSRRKPDSADSSARATGRPAARSAASGSVNCGCTTTARRGARPRAINVNASAPPAVGSTMAAGSACAAAIAATAGVASG